MAGSVSLAETVRRRAWYQVQRRQPRSLRQYSHVKRTDGPNTPKPKQDRRESLPIADTR